MEELQDTNLMPKEFYDLKGLLDHAGWKYMAKKLTPRIEDLKTKILSLDLTWNLNKKEYTLSDIYKIRLMCLETCVYDPTKFLQQFDVEVNDLYKTMFDEDKELVE